MTAIKIQNKVTLDFSNKKVTKHSIRQALRYTEMYYMDPLDKGKTIYNIIKVGIYNIHLIFDPSKIETGFNKLRNYGKFTIFISDKKSKIDLNHDSKFNNQYWIKNISHLRINNLIDVILYCNRIDKLKLFL